MRVTTRADFEAWLRSCFDLADARVDTLEVEGTPPRPTRIELGMTLATSPHWRAGERRSVRRLHLVTDAVETFELPEDGFGAGHWCEGAELVDSPAPIAFELDVPARLRLVCRSIEVAESEETEEILPLYGEHEITVTARTPLPSAADWIDVFARRGIDVVWRRYGDGASPTEDVPDDYVGWFLQLPNDVVSSTGGVFISSLRRGQDERICVTLTCSYGCRPDLWAAAGVLLSAVPGSTVQCGNVTLSGDAWRAHALSRHPKSVLLLRLVGGTA